MTPLVAIALALAAPATAGSLPPVPGVVLDDTYAPSAKASAPPPRPDLICWRNTERTEWRWAFTAPAPWWVPAPSGAGCDLAAPGNLNERRPGFAAPPSPPKHDKPWWDKLSSPTQIPRGRESEGMPDDFMRPTSDRPWWNPARTWRD